MTENKRAVSDSQARKTALIVACVLLAVSAWNYHRGRMTILSVAGGAGVALVLVGLLAPALARRFHVFWMKLAGVLGWVNSRILLSLMFYVVFMPYRVVSRLFGRDPLNRRAPRRASYWTQRKTTRQTKEQFEWLF